MLTSTVAVINICNAPGLPFTVNNFHDITDFDHGPEHRFHCVVLPLIFTCSNIACDGKNLLK